MLPQEMVDSLFLAPDGEAIDWTRLAYGKAQRLASRNGWRASRSDLEDIAVSGVSDGAMLFRQMELEEGQDVSALAARCVRRATARAAYAYFCGSSRTDALRSSRRTAGELDVFAVAENRTAEVLGAPPADPRAAADAIRAAAGRMLPEALRPVACYAAFGFAQKDIAVLEHCTDRTVRTRLAECKEVLRETWVNVYAVVCDAIQEVLDDDKPLSGLRRPCSRPRQVPATVAKGHGIGMTVDDVHGNPTWYVDTADPLCQMDLSAPWQSAADGARVCPRSAAHANSIRQTTTIKRW